jgi:biotin carboxyl carrier protein
LKTPKAGKVLEIRVSVGQAVEKGEILALIE